MYHFTSGHKKNSRISSRSSHFSYSHCTGRKTSLHGPAHGILQLLPWLPENLKSLLLGITEITTGAAAIAEKNWELSLTFPLLLAFTASGGLCIAFQTKSMLGETDLSLAPYLKGKLCMFFITLTLGILFVKIIKVII